MQMINTLWLQRGSNQVSLARHRPGSGAENSLMKEYLLIKTLVNRFELIKGKKA